MSLDWLIVGGGIHGVHLAVRLLAETDVLPERLRIVDPGAKLLSRWRTCTATTGMTHLRSPAVHHLDVSPWSLRRFAGRRGRSKKGVFAPPYDRPSLRLFNAHCDQLVESYGLGDLHVQARAVGCRVACDGVGVRLSSDCELEAQNVVLAIGAGAGISGVQVALRLRAEGHRAHLIARHELRHHQFDSDPGWLGPKGMTGFSREPDPARRRDLITASLPCAQCGYPLVDMELRWHPRVHVSGPLAELELGPVSRNIAGARRAGDRIVASVRETQRGAGPCIHHPVTPGAPH